MAWEYSKKRPADKSFDPKCCKASVSHGWGHSNQCLRKVWKDGWCRQHHPDSERARSEKSLKRWANTPLARATQRIEELETRAETSLYVPSGLFPSFVKFLKLSIDCAIIFDKDFEADKVQIFKRLRAFCKEFQEVRK